LRIKFAICTFETHIQSERNFEQLLFTAKR